MDANAPQPRTDDEQKQRDLNLVVMPQGGVQAPMPMVAPPMYGAPPPMYGAQPMVQAGPQYAQVAPGMPMPAPQYAGAYGMQPAMGPVGMPIHLNHDPTSVTCPSCRWTVVSNVQYETGTCTWIWVLLLFCIGCWPCYFIPLVTNFAKDAVHTCSKCGTMLGRKQPN